MTEKRQTLWQKHPELTDILIKLVTEDDNLEISNLAERINLEARELRIKAKISPQSVQGKLSYLSQTDSGVKEVYKRKRQRELLEDRHDLRKAVLSGQWLSIIGIEDKIDFSEYLPPDTSAKDPHIVGAMNGKTPKVGVINAPLIGSLVELDVNKDILMNTLRYYQAAGVERIIITGDLIYMLTQKWGTQKPRKAYSVGVEPDPEIISEAYPNAVLEEKSIEDRLRDGDIVFTTVKARLDLVMKELFRVFRDGKGKPLFKGDILIVTGETEEQISTFYANDIVRLLVRQEKDVAQARIEDLRLELKHEEDSVRKDRLNRAITEWKVYKEVLVFMTSAEDKYIKMISEQMAGYIAKKIQEVVPNSVIVGRGDAHINVGDKKFFVTREKASTAYNGTSAGLIRKKTLTHAKNTPGLNIPDVILVGGMNPYWTGLLITHFIPELAGDLDDRRMAHIIQLPTTLSAGRYRQELRNFSEVKGNIEKVAAVSDFESGGTIISWSDPGEILNTEILKSDLLTNEDIFGVKGMLEAVISGKEKRSRMIYSIKQGCEHAGARFITQYPSPNDPDGRFVKSLFQIVFDSLIKAKAPIHMFQSDGDTLHWANYGVHKEGFPDSRLSVEDFLNEIMSLNNDESLTHKQRQHKLAIMAYEHAVSEGVLQPDGQLSFYQLTAKRLISY